MATRPINLSLWETMTLLREKGELIALHLKSVPHPANVNLDEMGKEIIRMGELHLHLKEGVAALPKPTHPAHEGKRA